jgi:hypothetical protein
MITTIVWVTLIVSAPIAVTAISNAKHSRKNRTGWLKTYKQRKLKRVWRSHWTKT